MNETSLIIGPILQFFFPDLADESRRAIHGYIRKCAHFTEYAVLSLFAVRALLLTGWTWRNRAAYLIPVILAVFIASADELNQSFEATRTSSGWDVGLDVLGGIAGSLAGWSFLRWRRSREVTTARPLP
jgi:VanZ family protein